ncbi:hypothetical protein V6N13_092898 [Hibiscus sabdariffa]
MAIDGISVVIGLVVQVDDETGYFLLPARSWRRRMKKIRKNEKVKPLSDQRSSLAIFPFDFPLSRTLPPSNPSSTRRTRHTAFPHAPPSPRVLHCFLIQLFPPPELLHSPLVLAKSKKNKSCDVVIHYPESENSGTATMQLISLFAPQVIPNTRSFPYTFKSGLRSAIRVARVVKEAVDRNETGIRWFVFGDDDTIFVVDNLVKVFSKYDHDKWYYIGSSSESYEQNVKYSFGMVYSGGGFAISYSLGKVLARVLDSCLMRYGQLYGSDSRVVWLSLV